MNSLRPWYDLIRFHEYGPFFIACGIVGSLFAITIPDFRLFTLLAFIAAFSASAFIVNDLVDVEEDRMKQHWRNPIALGKLTKRAALVAFMALASISIATLSILGISVMPVGIMALALYWGYSWGPKFKTLPFADVVVHGAVPALYVVMGYTLYRPLTYSVLLLAGISFMLATMTGVIQELRDAEADKNFRRTSVLILGHSRAADLAIALMTGAVAMYCLLVLDGFLNPMFILFVPLVYFLFEPLAMLRNRSLEPEKIISKLRMRGLALSVLLVAAYLILR